MFRNENSKVVRRVRGSGRSLDQGWSPEQKPSFAPSPQPNHSISPRPVENYNTPSIPALPWDSELQSILSAVYPLELDLHTPEHRGLAFFFTHYSSINSPFIDGTLDPKMSPLVVDLQRSKPFYDAVLSIGLAGLSNVTNDKSLMLAAKHKHAETLSHVAGVLNKIDSADLEETLKQVMLLGIFEVVDCDDSPFRKRGLHLDGAAALLRAITQNEMLNKMGQPVIRMQLQLCFVVFIRYFEVGKNIPPEFAETIYRLQEVQFEEDLPAANLISVISHFIEFYARMKRSELSDPEAIIRSALICEAELEQWEQLLPDEWRPKITFPVESEPSMYKDYYKAYRDLWTARIWGHYHWARILINEIILVQFNNLEWHMLDQQLQRDRCLQTISRIALDICNSVPSQFFRHSTWYGGGDRVPQMTGVFLLLFPLAVAGGASGVPDDLHHWVVKLLEQIGRQMGVRLALALIPRTKLRREATKMGEQGLYR